MDRDIRKNTFALRHSESISEHLKVSESTQSTRAPEYPGMLSTLGAQVICSESILRASQSTLRASQFSLLSVLRALNHSQVMKEIQIILKNCVIHRVEGRLIPPWHWHVRRCVLLIMLGEE
jgi:hypothetical protein